MDNSGLRLSEQRMISARLATVGTICKTTIAWAGLVLVKMETSSHRQNELQTISVVLAIMDTTYRIRNVLPGQVAAQPVVGGRI